MAATGLLAKLSSIFLSGSVAQNNKIQFATAVEDNSYYRNVVIPPHIAHSVCQEFEHDHNNYYWWTQFGEAIIHDLHHQLKDDGNSQFYFTANTQNLFTQKKSGSGHLYDNDGVPFGKTSSEIHKNMWTVKYDPSFINIKHMAVANQILLSSLCQKEPKTGYLAIIRADRPNEHSINDNSFREDPDTLPASLQHSEDIQCLDFYSNRERTEIQQTWCIFTPEAQHANKIQIQYEYRFVVGKLFGSENVAAVQQLERYKDTTTGLPLFDVISCSGGGFLVFVLWGVFHRMMSSNTLTYGTISTPVIESDV